MVDFTGNEDTLRQIGGAVAGYADAYQQAVEGIYKSITDLEIYWKGKESEKYIENVRGCQAEIKKIVDEYEVTSRNFNFVAQKVDTARGAIQGRNSTVTM